MNERYVTYEEFGAKGDGKTDDFAAIKLAHDYANEHGLPVRADDNAHYYMHDSRIDGEPCEIIVKTDVCWGNAKFTIDDTDISVIPGSDTYSQYTKYIFRIIPDAPKQVISDPETLSAALAAGLGRNTTRVALSFDYPVMIVPYNSAHNVYRRRGYGGFAGTAMHEVIVLDKDGNVSEETPIMFDYENLDYIDVYRLDERHITIEGGEFTTKSSRVNTLYYKENGEKAYYGGYINRGLDVCRSFTTVKNVKHYITGEVSLNDQVDENGEVIHISACYHGFYTASYANHVTFEDCVISGRRCYKRFAGGTGGTYGLSGNCVNGIVFKGCTQANFWVTVDENLEIHPAKEGDPGALPSMASYVVRGNSLKMHWGIGGTNFCKNMQYIGCTLSRLDAHMGLYHGKIIDSTVNYMAITGNGDFTVENTRWFAEGPGFGSNSLIHLRADYGSTWEGNITMKNIKAYVNTSAPTYTFYHSYQNWYFGYVAHFPNISIDGIQYYDINTFEPLPLGYEVNLTGSSLVTEPALHLPSTLNVAPAYPDVDEDGDGFVDGTNIPRVGEVNRKGVVVEDSRINLNPIAPPTRIEMRNCSNTVVVRDTSCDGLPDGGFFGKTEFVTEGAKYVGTDYSGEDTVTSKFR